MFDSGSCISHKRLINSWVTLDGSEAIVTVAQLGLCEKSLALVDELEYFECFDDGNAHLHLPCVTVATSRGWFVLLAEQ